MYDYPEKKKYILHIYDNLWHEQKEKAHFW